MSEMSDLCHLRKHRLAASTGFLRFHTDYCSSRWKQWFRMMTEIRKKKSTPKSSDVNVP